MGLDIVECVLAVEEAFGVTLADADLAAVTTVRELGALVGAAVGGIAGATSVTGMAPCASQRAFHRVRRALVAEAGAGRRAVAPPAVVADLLPEPGPDRDAAWARVPAALGTGDAPGLVGRTGWRRAVGYAATTVGVVAAHLVERAPHTLKAPGEPWTEAEVHALLLRLLERTAGVDVRDPGAVLDAHLVRDLGLGSRPPNVALQQPRYTGQPPRGPRLHLASASPRAHGRAAELGR